MSLLILVASLMLLWHLGEYQYKAAFVADLEINMMACLTEIMGRAKFK